jgi:acetyltransferase-like isoleucine patch superfamily enzyme
MGEMRERMLRGELYIADDADNEAEFDRVQELLAEFNGTPPRAWNERDGLLRRTLRHVGKGVVVRPPFYCEYGAISIGDRTFVNVEAVMLDFAPITIGTACQIATRVHCSPRRTPSTLSRAGSDGSTASRSRSQTTSGSAAVPSSAPASPSSRTPW